jgi:hypothetical protein
MKGLIMTIHLFPNEHKNQSQRYIQPSKYGLPLTLLPQRTKKTYPLFISHKTFPKRLETKWFKVEEHTIAVSINNNNHIILISKANETVFRC